MKFLILAGGHGTRLWPISTAEKPKQFQSFVSNRTLIQMAFDRIKDLVPVQDIFVSSNVEYATYIREQLPEIPDKNIILEPQKRDTCPGISYAMQYIAQHSDLDETVSIIYSDHLIQNTPEFQKALITGHSTAKTNKKFTIIEVKAKFPNPNLGYAKIGKQVHDSKHFPIYELDHFTEKPDVETAKTYLESYKYLWNTGYYIWRIDHYFENLQKYSKEVFEVTQKIQTFPATKELYQQFPKISLDYSLIEKMPASEIWIIPADLGWSDIGTWNSLFQELTHSDNVTEGQVDHLESKNCLIINKNPNYKITAINTKDLAIIQNGDQILVCNMNSDNLIKQYLNSQNGS